MHHDLKDDYFLNLVLMTHFDGRADFGAPGEIWSRHHEIYVAWLLHPDRDADQLVLLTLATDVLLLLENVSFSSLLTN